MHRNTNGTRPAQGLPQGALLAAAAAARSDVNNESRKPHEIKPAGDRTCGVFALPRRGSAQGAGPFAEQREVLLYERVQKKIPMALFTVDLRDGKISRFHRSNEWLGHVFNGVLFNTKDPAEQRRIAERIVDVDYIQHNRLVEHGRAPGC